MATRAARVTVDTTAGGTRIDSAVAGSGSILVRNQGSVAVYLGASGVTSSTGFQLDPQESVQLDLAREDTLYGITASSSASVHLIQVGA